MLTATLATTLARTALANVVTEYPYKLDQLLAGTEDLATPRALHPVFWGSYDWHSCVHMHWTLVRLLRRFPDHELAGATRAHLQARLTPQAIAGELATLRRPHRQTFERPYGWGWLLKLAAELELLAQEQGETSAWRDAVRPLAGEFAERFLAYLPRADYPSRGGAHVNTAFALLLALAWCDAVQHRALRQAIAERANRWFGRDRRYPAAYEPSGEDFLSAGLVEAALMLRVVDGCSFADWWALFLPTDDALVRLAGSRGCQRSGRRQDRAPARSEPLPRLVLVPAVPGAGTEAARPSRARHRGTSGGIAAGRDRRRLCRYALARVIRIARAGRRALTAVNTAGDRVR